jgi:hypothetical protein
MIETFNKTISNAINKEDPNYVAIFGTEDFTPEVTIVDSEDFNCGALCNELEYLRTVSAYYYQSFDLDIAETENLEELITAFMDLPRRNTAESDAIYRSRFRAIINEQVNYRRTTRWAILDALRYFIADVDNDVQILEIWAADPTWPYFEIRIEGTENYDDAIFMNNVNQAYLNQNFVGGAGVGAVISYLGEIIDRIKAVGVDYDILFISQDRFTKTVDAIIGAVQFYKAVDAVIKRSETITKTIDAEVV